MKHDKMISYIRKSYAKRLKKDLQRKQISNAERICEEYQKRFTKYMKEADFGVNDCKFSSYLNIYSGLAAYEILREQGMSEQESIVVYDYMCSTLRKMAGFMHKFVDFFPGSFKLVKKSLLDDLTSEKAVCWDTELLRNDDSRLEYRISKCLYYDTCAVHGYPEFTKVFCTHDIYAYGVLKKHTKFERYSTLGEGGECCHDAFIRIK